MLHICVGKILCALERARVVILFNNNVQIGPPDMLEVDYNETVRDVIAKALEIFQITVSVLNTPARTNTHTHTQMTVGLHHGGMQF